ncbi:MAG TPA: ATP-binding cassette domain-containing protein [Aestuariivirgaceae bacterium]|nr:ATP-binding cassette domain-containing protein [Aestuariivirgaceae bacterium]
MLRIETVSKSFGGVEAVHGLSLNLAPRGVVVVAGPAGSGKSTLCDLVTGRHRPDTGRILLDDTPITRLPMSGRARLGIVARGIGDDPFPTFTVFETLILAHEAAHRRSHRLAVGLPEAAEVAAYRALRDVGIERRADVPTRDLDRDDRLLLELATALAADARLIVLDELFKGVGPVLRDRLLEIVDRAKRSRAVLIGAHALEPVLPIADRGVVLSAGRIIAAGQPSEIASLPAVRAAYLGDEVDHA